MTSPKVFENSRGKRMSTKHFVAELIRNHDATNAGQIGTNFENLVQTLQCEIDQRARTKITSLNGSGSPVYDPQDPMFDESVKMVAEDVANAIVQHKIDLAVSYLEGSAKDVLVQQAHLCLDY